jgi:sarcosine oxidase delta subunit
VNQWNEKWRIKDELRRVLVNQRNTVKAKGAKAFKLAFFDNSHVNGWNERDDWRDLHVPRQFLKKQRNVRSQRIADRRRRLGGQNARENWKAMPQE